jgi:O-acetyl-ADP-ribose deacetylase (regulator of RNase III)
MDGGVDYAISEHFGRHLQKKVQEYITLMYYGEQPVGTSFIISINHDLKEGYNESRYPFLAHTPTMRAPTIIRGTDNVYSAFRAALMAITDHNKRDTFTIQSVVCIGLGTACGGVDPEEAARQMELAYKNMLNPPRVLNWPMVKRRHLEIATSHRGHCLDVLAP